MPEKDPDAPRHRRAVKLVQQGLTPQVVTEAMCRPDAMEWVCRKTGTKPHDVEWLAERWPVQVILGHYS